MRDVSLTTRQDPRLPCGCSRKFVLCELLFSWLLLGFPCPKVFLPLASDALSVVQFLNPNCLNYLERGRLFILHNGTPCVSSVDRRGGGRVLLFRS